MYDVQMKFLDDGISWREVLEGYKDRESVSWRARDIHKLDGYWVIRRIEWPPEREIFGATKAADGVTYVSYHLPELLKHVYLDE